MIRLDGVRILVVEDEPFMRKTIHQMLKSLGAYDVREAGDAAAALEAVTAYRPDLIICDIGMSPMSGVEFVGVLRAHPNNERRQTPVIMLTSHTEEGTVFDALRVGIDDYLVKPVSLHQLAHRLSLVLRQREAGTGDGIG